MMANNPKSNATPSPPSSPSSGSPSPQTTPAMIPTVPPSPDSSQNSAIDGTIPASNVASTVPVSAADMAVQDISVGETKSSSKEDNMGHAPAIQTTPATKTTSKPAIASSKTAISAPSPSGTPAVTVNTTKPATATTTPSKTTAVDTTSTPAPVVDAGDQPVVAAPVSLSSKAILLILRMARLSEVLKYKKVCKAWKKVIEDEFKARKLIVFLKQFSYNDIWTFTKNEQLDPRHAFKVTKLEKFFKSEFVKTFFKNIEKLMILNFPFDNEQIDLDQLNHFAHLEHLEIRSLKFKDQAKLNLPNLKTLYVSKQSFGRVTINCPRLNKLKTTFNLNHFKIEHPLSLQHLECTYFSSPIKSFVNLEYLYVEFISHLSRNFLEKMTKLKELQFFDYGISNVVESARKQKKKYDRKDFSIYFLGINFDHPPKGELKFERFNMTDENLPFYVDNQNKLAKFVPFIRKVNYNSLITKFKNALPQDFHARFPNIGFVHIEGKVENPDYVLKFLRDCKQLRILLFKTSALESRHFESLADYAPSITYLTIQEELDNKIDYGFVTRFKNLIKFQVDRNIPFTLLLQAFTTLEYLKSFYFKIQASTIFIKKTNYYLLIISDSYTDCFKNLDDLVKVLKKNYGSK